MAGRDGRRVIVITGASSGVGRETACHFAQQGDALVLAARNTLGLQESAEAVHSFGGAALVHKTDVRNWAEVNKLAQTAVEHFGRIDVWVNNASVSEYAPLERMTPAEIEQIVQTNLLGTMYGTRAALLQMKKQGHGAIINIASVLGSCAVPLQSIYCAAKHGVIGFSDAVRLELKNDRSPVSITVVSPSSTNTPLFSHARSKMGVKPRPISPVYEPATVARAVLHAAEHPQREIVVGGAGKLFSMLRRLAPSLFDLYSLYVQNTGRHQLANKPPQSRDTVFESGPQPERVRGEFSGLRRSAYTRLFEYHPNLKRVSLGGVALLGVALAYKLRPRRGGGHRLPPEGGTPVALPGGQ